ncbi:photosystem II stability/assembly factor HCF136, chloroplastic-like isoform X2 [Chenopodium quinoa]|uniref:photosystem II stability/assembly factor HCF136, chloroplastic-like isoform X2 n=1 Tax=Chenopodium quinoa TaxID=63459 RepID=UPI000B7827FB|nr:photosystem II stability/assembly factor HCF136, chloroplastic-like isoform X2 [Chenopodium quinoa]
MTHNLAQLIEEPITWLFRVSPNSHHFSSSPLSSLSLSLSLLSSPPLSLLSVLLSSPLLSSPPSILEKKTIALSLSLSMSNLNCELSSISQPLFSNYCALSLSMSPLLTTLPAKSDDLLSEWERVYLSIDPGVFLLDIAFVPDDPNHGFFKNNTL